MDLIAALQHRQATGTSSLPAIPHIPAQYHEAVKELAIAYNAFNSANRRADVSGIKVWGRMLKAEQDASGVLLVNDQVIDEAIAAHQDERVRHHLGELS